MAVPEMLKLKEIIETLDRIETTLTDKPKTTNETRIGALRRISEAVDYINSEIPGPGSTIVVTGRIREITDKYIKSVFVLNKTKEILLGR